MNRTRIGIVGVGNMGGAMAMRLLDQGWDVVIRDIRPEVEAPLRVAGATVAATPAAIAAQADVVLIVVVDAAQIDAVLFDEASAAKSQLSSRHVVLLNSTIAPGDASRIAARLISNRIMVLDAPISGGPARARAGQMSMMIAGADQAFEHARAAVDVLSSHVFRIGPEPGQAATVKLVNNLLAGIHLVAAAEAFALGARAGIDLRKLYDVVVGSSGQSWMLADRVGRYLAADREPRAQTHILAKDIALALELSRSFGADCALGELAQRVFEHALAAGLGDEDDSAICRLFDVSGSRA
jgi:3-hydroxyisobutyrate dehydrogenase